MQDMVTDGDGYSDALRSAMHKTIRKVSEDIESMGFNTAIAAMMKLVNQIYANGSITRGEYRTLLILLNPFAPHITEELFEQLGLGVLNEQAWPEYDPALCVDEQVEIVVQICGKIKSKLMIPTGADEATAVEMALADEKVQEALAGKTIRKQIYVQNKLVNFVAN